MENAIQLITAFLGSLGFAKIGRASCRERV